MKKIAISLCFFFTFVICVNVFADILYLKNGNQFEGWVVRQDDEKLTFRIGEEEDGVDVTFFNDEILRIDKPEISSFITLPFGEGQQVDMPRPIFEQEPIITEVTTEAKEHKQQSSQATESEQANKDMENSTDAKNKLWQEMLLEMSPEMLPEELNETISSNPYSTMDRISESSNSYAPFRSVTEELTQLLDDEEKHYFTTINSIMHDIAGQMAVVLADPSALAEGDEVLNALEQEMPSEIEKAIANLKNLRVPELFVNFHGQYLSNLDLMKGMFTGMSKGSKSDSQSKMQDLQSAQLQLQDELRNILAIKKKQLSL